MKSKAKKLWKKILEDISLLTIDWIRTGAAWFVHGAMAYLIGTFTMDWMGFILLKYPGTLSNPEEFGRVIAFAFVVMYLLWNIPIYRERGK